MTTKIIPTTDPVELAASVEVLKLVAFTALSIAIDVSIASRLKGDEDRARAIHEYMNDLKRAFIRRFQESEYRAKFRRRRQIPGLCGGDN